MTAHPPGTAHEWFQEAFRLWYLSLYAHRDEKEAAHTVNLLARETGLAVGARVLDAPCGAGRHARAFARRGFRVTALDLSPDLLTAAAQEGEEANARVSALQFTPPQLNTHNPSDASPQFHASCSLEPRYLRADLREIPLATARFDLVANLFSSFGYFAEDCENYSVLQELARVCRPDGWVVLDYFNATQVRRRLVRETERRTDDGWFVREHRTISGDPPRIEKRAHIESADGEVREFIESVRLFEPDELESMMRRAGAPVDKSFGDYHGQALSAESPRVILFGRRGA